MSNELLLLKEAIMLLEALEGSLHGKTYKEHRIEYKGAIIGVQFRIIKKHNE